MNKPLIIIGTGLAGYTLAKEFRKLDQTTPLVIITAHAGNFYSKPLLSTALTNQKTPEHLAVFSSEKMAEQLNAEIRTHTIVTAINPKEQAVYIDNEAIAYDRLVLACGADKIHPPLKGDALPRMCSVNNLQDYTYFREWLKDKKHIGIIGSGLVGCEFANDLINVGYQVDVIAQDAYPLMRFVPSPIGQALQKALAAQGVRWHLSHLVSAINQSQQGDEIKLLNGGSIVVDGVLSAIGLRAHVALAKTAGIQINRGIVVDRHLQTSVEHIYALGDCAEVAGQLKQYITPLLHCAKALAKILAGQKDPVHYPAMPVVIKTPSCPIVTVPPNEGIEGEWRVEGEGQDLSAAFYDHQNVLQGFALSGAKSQEKMQWVKRLEPSFS